MFGKKTWLIVGGLFLFWLQRKNRRSEQKRIAKIQDLKS